MIFMEFGELLNGTYFLAIWRKYLLMINISVTTLSSRKDSSKENLANSGELGGIQNHLAVWSVLDSEKWNQLTVWMEFGQCGLLPTCII